MAGIQNRTAAELKAELTAAIAQSRALLGEAPDEPGSAVAMTEPDSLPDRLTGLELSFDGNTPPSPEDFDYTSLSDEELEILLRETDPAPSGSPSPDPGNLVDQIGQNPLPWALGALVIGAIGARGLIGEGLDQKNPRQNASQSENSAITHGSLMAQIMKTAFEMAKPALLEAAQAWLIRFVEKKS